MTKVLVTGASGFIGQNLVERLIRRADQVTCLVRQTSRCECLQSLDVRIARSDLASRDSLRVAVRGMDVVFHLAGCVRAWDSREMFRVNEMGTAVLADACAAQTSPPTFVYVSSLAAAGPSSFDRPRREADPPHPISQYGKSKLAAECQLLSRAAQLPTTIVRPPIVFGARGRDMLKMFKSVRLGLHFVPGMRPQRFSLIDVGSLSDVLIAASEHGMRLTDPEDPSCPGVYYAALPEMPTYAELGRLIALVLHRRRLLVLPTPLALGWLLVAVNAVRSWILRRPLLLNADKIREATAGSWTCCADRAARELAFLPKDGLLELLGQTAQWYRQQGWL